MTMRFFIARALTSALLGLSCSAQAANGDFGRLFYSADERRALDAPPPPPPPAPEKPAPAPPPPRSRLIDGILQRPDGRVTVWLDGFARPAEPDFRLRAILQLVPRTAPQARLHVGDHWPPLPPDDAFAAATQPTASPGTKP